MVKVLSVSSAHPPYRVSPDDLAGYLRASLTPSSATRFGRVLNNSEVRSRYTVLPFSDLLALRTIEDRADRFVRHSVRLGEEVARKAMIDSGVDGSEIGTLISVSSTGYAVPSLDAHFERLGLSPTVRRLPISQLGCAGGVSALSTAAELARVSSGTALVVTVEICSLCLQNAEPSRTDLIASILFGDGAAAAIVSGSDTERGTEVIASRSARRGWWARRGRRPRRTPTAASFAPACEDSRARSS
jgi:alkylresorcinol/alkylpyrone synthase